MFTEKIYFSTFGIKWDRAIITTVISDHLSHAQGRWSVYFSFTNLKYRSNGYVTVATAHHHISRAAPLVLEIYLSTSWHMPLCQFYQLAWKTNQSVELCKSFTSTCSSKVFYIKLITNSRTLVESFVAVLGNRAATSFCPLDTNRNSTLHTMLSIIVESADNVTDSQLWKHRFSCPWGGSKISP